MSGRWKVACINWSHPTAPKAVAYLLGPEGWATRERYLPTHADAITYAHEQATRQALAARFNIPPENPVVRAMQEKTC